MIVYVIIVIVLCLILSALFSASEMSFSSCNRMRIEKYQQDGSKKASTALKILDRFDNALSAVLLGNDFVNIAASSLASVAMFLIFKDRGDSYTWASTAVITLLVIIFGETIPKIVAEKNANRWTVASAYFVRFFMIILKPFTFLVVGLVNLLTKGLKNEKSDTEDDEAVEELHKIIDTAKDEDVIDEDESELVKTAIDFSDICAYEVMTARVDMVALDLSADWEESIEIIEKSTYSRLPVYEDSADKIVGILSLNHFLKAYTENKKVDIRSLLLPACFVYKTTKLPEVMNQFRLAKQHLAIVTDEYGGTLGVITMEDVLEQIVGNIWDETDTVEPEIIEHPNGKYEIDGDMPISEFIELTGIDEDSFDYESETAGGWVIEMLGKFPSQGDSFDYKDLHVKVIDTDEHRVSKILVTKTPEEKENKK